MKTIVAILNIVYAARAIYYLEQTCLNTLVINHKIHYLYYFYFVQL